MKSILLSAYSFDLLITSRQSHTWELFCRVHHSSFKSSMEFQSHLKIKEAYIWFNGLDLAGTEKGAPKLRFGFFGAYCSISGYLVISMPPADLPFSRSLPGTRSVVRFLFQCLTFNSSEKTSWKVLEVTRDIRLPALKAGKSQGNHSSQNRL